MTTVPRPAAELSADEARRIALRAQGFLGAPDRRAGVRGVLRSLGQVQLDTISVLARSHELIPYARLGAVGRTTVEDAYWTGTHAFEYWSHAACVLPVEEWPLFAFRRRAYRGRPHWGHELSPGAYDKVIAQLRDEGPRTATELGGAKNKGEWWDWSDSKIAVERALMYGEVVVVERRGWKRVYDLAERAVPEALLHDDLDDAECVRRLVRQAGEALGVGTRADIADYHRLKGEQFDAAVEASGLVPVTVAGWGKPAWADPAALATEPRGRHRTTLLSPFDSLIWERARTERIFGFTHRLEAYVPKQKRVYGYFAMPVLAGGRLVGRVDPAREGRTLVARQVTLDGPKAVPAVARALREAAEWVGCDTVTILPDRVNLPALAPELVRELG
ncbi:MULTISPECIES: crosslink repair DNA glycosylase YcaQ family protein [unclassified Streptomyces]|uniref:winged helix-turn-helix domain-containing protein n=1 Tax=unclassified Streptomyces TaxID=2593676 RepID=UPI00339E546C